MEETQQQAVDRGAALDELVRLVAKAAQTIQELQSQNAGQAEQIRRFQAEAESAGAELQARAQRIAELEQRTADLEGMVSTLQPAADRHLRMKAQLESRPEAQGGFTANGMTYNTFDEAFDVAYPPAVDSAA